MGKSRKESGTLVGVRADGKLVVRISDTEYVTARRANNHTPAADYVKRLGEAIDIKELKAGWKEVEG